MRASGKQSTGTWKRKAWNETLMEITLYFRFMVCPVIMGGLGAWFVSRYGQRLNMMDRPTNRSSHVRNVPKGGSIGILITFIFSSLLLDFSGFFWMPVVF